jgi:hypothetical protein
MSSSRSAGHRSGGRAAGDRSWLIVSRLGEYDGEGRANLLRITGIALFYGIHLINYHGLSLGFLELQREESIDRRLHEAVTALAVAWTAAAIAIQFCLRWKLVPPLFKFVTTGLDVVFLTSLLILADGPRSPMVIAYFLLIPLASLRFSLPLVRFAAAGAVLGYLFLCGYARWFTERDIRVPRYSQMIVVAALILTGVLLGQAVRRGRRMARDYAERRAEERPASVPEAER